jgi:hypothetical protein
VAVEVCGGACAGAIAPGATLAWRRARLKLSGAASGCGRALAWLATVPRTSPSPTRKVTPAATPSPALASDAYDEPRLSGILSCDQL